MNSEATIFPTPGNVKTISYVLVVFMLLRTSNDHSKRYPVCQLHWTYLAFNGVNTLKFIVRIENDMNDGDKITDDIPKKKKKSTYLS